MTAKDLQPSPSSSSTSSFFPLPDLVESLDDEEGEEEVIVVFEEEARDSSWETWGEQLLSFTGWDDNRDGNNSSSNNNSSFPGYSRRELAQKVTVVQSNRDSVTGNFIKEQKSLSWCLEQGFEEVQPKVWAKSWYFHYLYGETEGKRVWVDTQNRRLVKERNGKAIEIHSDAFDCMMAWKEKANRDFARGQYNGALEKYDKAEEIIAEKVMGIYLVAEQRKELVNVLSNQAECYLRMNKSRDALDKATSALQLESSHVKSALRRGRAMLLGALHKDDLFAGASGSVMEDLRSIAHAEGEEGAKEATALLVQFESKLDLISNVEK